VFEDAGFAVDDRPAELGGQSIGEALLAVHRSYFPALSAAIDADLVHGLAHITGGGLQDNIPSVLPDGTAVRIRRNGMPRPPIFDLLRDRGGIGEDESYRGFTRGFGMVVFVAPGDVEAVRAAVGQATGDFLHDVGEVVAGAREVLFA
jgi:phosphoribosylformylglycinamidine cyclo-ligase